MAGAIYLGARKVGSAEYVAPTNYIKLTATATLTPSGLGYNFDIDAVGSGWNVRRLAIDPPILYVRTPGVEYNIVECVWEEGVNYLEGTCSYGTFYLFPPDNPRVVSDSPDVLLGNCLKISNASTYGTILQIGTDFDVINGVPYLVGPDGARIGSNESWTIESYNGTYYQAICGFLMNNTNYTLHIYNSGVSLDDLFAVGNSYGIESSGGGVIN